MRLDPAALPDDAVAFLTERHLATLTTLRPDGTPHVVPVGFTWDADAGLARVITSGQSRKAAHAAGGAVGGGAGRSGRAGAPRGGVESGAGGARVGAPPPPPAPAAPATTRA